MRLPSITPESSLAIVSALEEAIALGAAPFLSVAAEKCGLNPDVVSQWYQKGKRGEGAYVMFYKLVAGLRAQWKTDIQSKMMNANKDDNVRVQNMKFLLQCMDRDLFDLTKKTPEGKMNIPEGEPADLEQALKQLEKN